MTTELESPTRTESVTDQTEPIDRPAIDAFPYGDSTVGYALPAPRATGVLSSGDDRDEGESGSTACPACGGATINGAGLFACVDCEWTGALR